MTFHNQQNPGDVPMLERFDEIRARLRERPLWRTAYLALENRQLREAIASPTPDLVFIGSSPAACKVTRAVSAVAELEGPLLITGEAGVGKRIVAHMVHNGAGGASRPFVAVNCAALPRDLLEAEIFGHEQASRPGAPARRPGRVELAEGGTLFLDEIAELPPSLQPKLLALLRHQELEPVAGQRSSARRFRLIASTTRDLRALAAARRFNRELTSRLSAVSMRVPALRERQADIPAIADYLLGRFGRACAGGPFTVTDEVRNVLMRYRWPGNVRELERVLQRAALASCGYQITLAELPEEVNGTPDLPAAGPGPRLAGSPLRDIERMAITETLGACGGNGAEAARRLGISKKGMYIKMKRFGLTTSFK